MTRHSCGFRAFFLRDPHQPGADKLDAGATVAAYKSLAHVERALRSIKTVDLNERSAHAKAKDASKTADDRPPLRSFRTLLKDLGTLAYNTITPASTSRPRSC